MSSEVQQLRNTAAATAGYTGPVGAVTVVVDDWSLRVHDGATAGGHAIAGSAPTRATGISAAGSTQSGATQLTTDWNVVSTVGSGQGVALRSGSTIGFPQWVYNAGVNPLKVYPKNGDGAAINALAANTAFTVEPNSGTEFRPISLTQWYSAQ